MNECGRGTSIYIIEDLSTYPQVVSYRVSGMTTEYISTIYI
jgi:hypothetical protein